MHNFSCCYRNGSFAPKFITKQREKECCNNILKKKHIYTTGNYIALTLMVGFNWKQSKITLKDQNI